MKNKIKNFITENREEIETRIAEFITSTYFADDKFDLIIDEDFEIYEIQSSLSIPDGKTKVVICTAGGTEPDEYDVWEAANYPNACDGTHWEEYKKDALSEVITDMTDSAYEGLMYKLDMEL